MNTLAQLRGKLAGKIEQNQEHCDKLRVQIAVLDAKGIKAGKDPYRNLESGIRASLDNHNGGTSRRVKFQVAAGASALGGFLPVPLHTAHSRYPIQRHGFW